MRIAFCTQVLLALHGLVGHPFLPERKRSVPSKSIVLFWRPDTVMPPESQNVLLEMISVSPGINELSA